MMKSNLVMIGNVPIGEGIPKICIPLVAKTKEELVDEARGLMDAVGDLVEWRADWYESLKEEGSLLSALEALQELRKKKPILFTIRTQKEGGEGHFDPEEYEGLLVKAIQSGLVDAIGLDIFFESTLTKKIIDLAKANEIPVVGSNHDFDKTPSSEDMVIRLRAIQTAGADICKMAVMPEGPEDVSKLIEASRFMYYNYADRPLVTMSMGKGGMFSRVCGEFSGSAITFGSLGKTSAPGQVEAKSLKEALERIHQIYQDEWK